MADATRPGRFRPQSAGVGQTGSGAAIAVYRRAGVPASPFDRRPDRDRFLGDGGLLSSALFAVLLIGQWIAVFGLDPCMRM